MANVNYTNPDGMYPLSSTNPNSGAVGAGTVPSSFMAGMMLPERMNDYRNVRDASLQSSLLANSLAGSQLEDYQQAGPSRRAGYQKTFEETQNQRELLPGQHDTNMQNMRGDQAAAKHDNTTKIAKAAMGLPQAQRMDMMNQFMSATTMLQGIPKEADPKLVMQFLNENGVSLGGMKPEFLQHLRELDPAKLKQAFEMEQLNTKEGGMDRRNDSDNRTNIRVAEINAQGDRTTGAGVGAANKEAWNRQQEEIYYRMGIDEGLSPERARDFARTQVWATINKEPYNIAGAKATGSVEEVRTLLESFKKQDGAKPPPKPPINTPPVPAPKNYGNDSSEDSRIKQQLGSRYDPKKKYRINPQTGRVQEWK